MTEHLEELWKRLEVEAGGSSAGIVRLRLTKERDDGLYVGIDSTTRRRVFLISISDAERISRALPQWREVRISFFKETSGPREQFVSLELANPEFRDLFSEFACDLYRALAPLERGPTLPRTLLSRINKWRQFLREHGAGGLDAQSQRGLFGELWFLGYMVLPRIGGVTGVRTWKGPEGAAQDFRLSDAAIEVKVAGERDPDHIRVSSELQLDDSDLDNLFLYVLRLSVSEAEGLSLPGLVREVRGALESDRSGLELFEDKLREGGYFGVHEPGYGALYVSKGDAVYRVRERFPRVIRPGHGVSNVRYDISLTACHEFRVDPASIVASLQKMATGG